MPTADVMTYRHLLITQYRGSVRLRALIDGALDIVQREILDSLSTLERQLSLDTAEGVWLDYIGLRLGLSRPSQLPEGTQFFGFGSYATDNTGTRQRVPDPLRTGFDDAPFGGLRVIEILIPVSDTWYRSLLRGRALVLRSGLSIPEIEAICAAACTGGGWVQERGARHDHQFGFATSARFNPSAHRRNTSWDAAPFATAYAETRERIVVHLTDAREGFVSLVRKMGLIPSLAGVSVLIQED